MRKEVIGDCVLYNGDCLEVLPELSGLHACVTDPPYHLTSVTRRLGNKDSTDARGFMGLEWDGGDISFNPGTWTSVYNTLLPGAHLVAFAGTRTYHRMAQAIEGAGFEIRACRRIESALRKPDLFAEDATAQRREASNDIVQELPL